MAKTSGAGVLRRARHVGRRAVDPGGVGREVIALAVDVGQGGDFETIRKRALAAGAVEAEVVDARAEFADDFLVPAIHANALYEGKYPLVSALSRPVIARHLVLAAREFGADAVAHGCTGKGNDQVRFEVSTRALAPDLDVLAPVRVWGFTRDDSIDYAAEARHPDQRHQEEPVLHRREPLGPGHRVRRHRGPVGPAARRHLALTRHADRRAAEPRRRRRRASSRACPSRSTASALPVHELVTAGSPSGWAPTASAARHGREPPGRASRAARPTSAPARSR